MRISAPARKLRRGFLLLEVVLALGVFSIAATGFAVAISRMGKASLLARQELQITRVLESALDEATSYPTLEVGKSSIIALGTDIDLETNVELIEEMLNEDGQALQEMYRITIIARWYQDGLPHERSAETWRFGRMYQP